MLVIHALAWATDILVLVLSYSHLSYARWCFMPVLSYLRLSYALWCLMPGSCLKVLCLHTLAYSNPRVLLSPVLCTLVSHALAWATGIPMSAAFYSHLSYALWCHVPV